MWMSADPSAMGFIDHGGPVGGISNGFLGGQPLEALRQLRGFNGDGPAKGFCRMKRQRVPGMPAPLPGCCYGAPTGYPA